MTRVIIALLLAGAVQQGARIADTLRPIVTVPAEKPERIGAVR